MIDLITIPKTDWWKIKIGSKFTGYIRDSYISDGKIQHSESWMFLCQDFEVGADSGCGKFGYRYSYAINPDHLAEAHHIMVESTQTAGHLIEITD